MSDAEQTKFQAWVQIYGIDNLIAAMREARVSIGSRAIYSWLRGEYEPRGPKARRLIAIAAGALSLEDLADHFSTVRGKKRMTSHQIIDLVFSQRAVWGTCTICESGPSDACVRVKNDEGTYTVQDGLGYHQPRLRSAPLRVRIPL